MILLWNTAAIFALICSSYALHQDMPLCLGELVPDELKTAQLEIQSFVHFVNKTESPGKETRVCCGKYGCFSRVPESRRCTNLTLLPTCEAVSDIKFILWTNKNPENYNVIDPEKDDSLFASNMVEKSKVVMFINSYLGSGNSFSVLKLKNVILKKHPETMFISVDWTKLSRAPYERALANGRMVAAVTAHFIRKLERNYTITPGRIHIIGINVGALIAGAIGKRIPGINRITGFDPVGWNKKVCPEIMEVTMSDANFVHIIHTNSKTYGASQPLGHLDVYINGAIQQPLCGLCAACNHGIVIWYYSATVENDLPYLAYECDNYDNFLKGKCSDGCGKDKSHCAPMGYRADEWRCHGRKSPTAMFMSMGTDVAHFHLFHYYVEIGCRDGGSGLWKYGRNLDSLKIKLIGENNKDTGFQEINAESIQFTTESIIRSVITSEIQIGKITNAVLLWTPNEEGASVTMQQCLSKNVTGIDDCAAQLGSNCRCLECTHRLKYLVAKNLESGMGTKFTGIMEDLVPNVEVEVACI